MRIAFLGTPEFAVGSISALADAGHEVACAVCQPDRPAGRGRALREPAVKRWARERGIPVLQPEKVRDGRLAADLGRLAPDCLAVAAYGRILGKDLLELAPHGAVNVHGSLLPRHRGAAPIQWAVAEGERETGVTIMQMDEGLDTGDVLLQRALPIAPEDTAEALSPRLALLGGEALVEALRLMERGESVPVPQDASRATLAPILEKAHGRADWSLPAQRLRDRLRGFSPWPGLWTTLDGKVVKILAADAVQAETGPGGRPGSARKVAGRGFAVSCGSGAILVLEVQPEGKRRQGALEFLNGLRRDAFTLGT
ncbi:MAG TPA: methionyl-tRNA formyltransferase [Anaeromyxobacteraceae bacterium]|nr:methionyl-tRNA formyltransferase [Anaeromyxobacteraceae bacterium]